MALCRKVRSGSKGKFSFDYKDEITVEYHATLDSPESDPLTVLTLMQMYGPNPLPFRRSPYLGIGSLYNLMCTNIELRPDEKSLSVWYATVTFGPPPTGEDEEQANENPLARPPIFNIEYIEAEYVVEKAKNVEALSHGDGNGGNRAADTLGPIVNGAGRRSDEPLMDVERNSVLIIQKNFSSLGAIADLNTTYQRTTNSDSVTVGSSTVTARRLQYQVTESLGKQIENGIEFWPGVTRIELKKTTDRILDNVGYDYWNGSEIAPFLVDNERPGEPINLNRDGTANGDYTETITYRHLTEVAYASLFT